VNNFNPISKVILKYLLYGVPVYWDKTTAMVSDSDEDLGASSADSTVSSEGTAESEAAATESDASPESDDGVQHYPSELEKVGIKKSVLQWFQTLFLVWPCNLA
jgi:hypothetical protein